MPIVSTSTIQGRIARQEPIDHFTELAPTGSPVAAGPLEVTVLQVATGSAATEQALAASPRNAAPAEGLGYVLAMVQVSNTGTRSLAVDNDDFGFIGSAGRIRRALQIVPPEPALAATIAPGERAEGWVAGLAEEGERAVVMTFSSRSLGGRWADRHFALVDGATLPNPVESAAVNDLGQSPESPALPGQTVVTADWALTLRETRFADDVVALYPESDYRTTALGSAAPELIPFWVAVQVELRNNRTSGPPLPLHFPVTAFGLAWGDGEPVPDVRLLSAPLPDLGGEYLPGGGASGWITMEVPAVYDGSLLRFQPFRTDSDVRYLTWGDGSAPSAPTTEAEPTPAPSGDVFEAGTEVIVIESDVNMRDAPSVNGAIVEVLPLDTVLMVTSGPEEADGYTWYGVEDPASGLSGFVASNFLARNA
jgi:hypothetical protein